MIRSGTDVERSMAVEKGGKRIEHVKSVSNFPKISKIDIHLN